MEGLADVGVAQAVDPFGGWVHLGDGGGEVGFLEELVDGGDGAEILDEFFAVEVEEWGFEGTAFSGWFCVAGEF